MAVQIMWNNLRWGYDSKTIRSVENLSTNRGLNVEKKTVGKKKKKTKQTVAYELTKLSFSYKVSALAGGSPRKEYEKVNACIGVHAPLYLNRSRFLAKQMMLKKVSASDYEMDRQGRLISVTITLEFEEWAASKKGIKKDKITGKRILRPGVATKPKASTALRVGASSSQKASKSKRNKGMKR